MTNMLEEIIKKKLPCYFISPHIDDAALSCGGLISYLAPKTEVTILTIFTEGREGPYTLSAKQTLKFSDTASALTLYEMRRREDLVAFSKLPVTIIHAGEVDSLYRLNGEATPTQKILGKIFPEAIHSYPTYRFHIAKGYMAASDRALQRRIEKVVSDLPEKAVIFAPMGIGNHSDHLLVKKAVMAVRKPILWLDQPYLLRDQESGVFTEIPQGFIEYKYEKKTKNELVKTYESQIKLLFSGQTIPDLPEYYLFSQK